MTSIGRFEPCFEQSIISTFKENETECMKFIEENTSKDESAFVKSLISGYHRYKNFNAKQYPYIVGYYLLLTKAVNGECNEDYEQEHRVSARKGTLTFQEISGISILNLLRTAIANGKQDPFIDYTPEYSPEESFCKKVRFCLPKYADEKGAFILNYTPNAKADGKLFLGSIHLDGYVDWTSLAKSEPKLVLELQKLFQNPVDCLARAGRRLICCCFCGKQLDTSISRYHGYGPVCAGKFGLPWEGDPNKITDKDKNNKGPEDLLASL
jgi:hypothetical protein